MKLIICIDSNNGIFFNKRRQSRDSVVITRIQELSANNILYINRYSLPLFENVMHEGIIVCDDIFKKATVDDFVFWEGTTIGHYEDLISEIYVFCWNRVYPADTYLDIDLSDKKWNLVSEEEFAGSSHENITLTKYSRSKQLIKEEPTL